METMDQGDVIIRPSSKGENHLTVTWKVNDGIYQHVDVREEGKENAFSLGSTLWINTEVRALQSMPGKELVGKQKHLFGRDRLAHPFCPCSCFQTVGELLLLQFSRFLDNTQSSVLVFFLPSKHPALLCRLYGWELYTRIRVPHRAP